MSQLKGANKYEAALAEALGAAQAAVIEAQDQIKRAEKFAALSGHGTKYLEFEFSALSLSEHKIEQYARDAGFLAPGE